MKDSILLTITIQKQIQLIYFECITECSIVWSSRMYHRCLKFIWEVKMNKKFLQRKQLKVNLTS